MDKLVKKLQELQKSGYETIYITDVLDIIHRIKQDNYIKKHRLNHE